MQPKHLIFMSEATDTKGKKIDGVQTSQHNKEQIEPICELPIAWVFLGLETYVEQAKAQ